MLIKGTIPNVPIKARVLTLNPPIEPPIAWIIAKTVMHSKGATIKIAV